jgi:1-acyl-sn-glycerol-3-phosphate acyltransferase
MHNGQSYTRVQWWQYVYALYVLLVFVLVMLLALPFVFLALLFGTIKGGNIIYTICKIWAGTWYFLVGFRHKNIYQYPHNKKQQYIFVANHISYMDIPPIVLTMKQPYRVLGKYEMVKYPVFGWIYKAAVILVDRSSPERRAKSVRALKAALNKGISIFIFPEGTFNETGKPLKGFYDGAFKLAIETGTPIKPILFVDSLQRMHYHSIFALTPGVNRVVYLQEISTENHTAQSLKEAVYTAMETALLNHYSK